MTMLKKFDFDFDFAAKFAAGENIRDLRGRAGSLHNWARTMALALSESDGQYNEFDVERVYKVLKPFEGQIEAIPAREYSVAMYIISYHDDVLRQILKLKKKLKADEADIDPQNKWLRLWWD